MTDEKPTGDAGASISERLEVILAAGEKEDKPEQESGSEAAPEKQPAVEVPENDAPEETEGPQYELSDIAKVLGLDEALLDIDEDGSLKIKTKIDGQEGAAKLPDFIKSYQLQGHVDAKVRQIAEKEKAIDARDSEHLNFAQNKLQELEALSNAAHQMLLQEGQQVDWDRLVMEDPIGYTAKRHEFERKSGFVNQLKQAAAYQKSELDKVTQWKDMQAFQAEAQRIPSLIPEWSDAKVRESEGVAMRQWLAGKGATEQSINGLRDAGLIAALRAGMVAEQKAPKVAATAKLVRAAPKLVRPGQGTDAKDRAGETVRGLRENIRKSGGKTGIAEYLIATGKV